MVEKIFHYHGQNMKIERAGERFPVRAFLQVVTGNAKQQSRLEVCPLGTVPQGRYIYTGPVCPELCQGDILLLGDKAYLVRQAETVQNTYTWAMCVEKGREDTWGVNG